MDRIVITKIEHRQKLYTAYMLLDEQRKLQQLQVFEPEEQSLIGHIYVGYVEKIVPNIQAAFVRIADGQKCYLPLNDVISPIYTRKQSKKPVLCEGDELLVQVVKDAVKTKDPTVSTKLSLHGRYCILTTENTRLGISSKLEENIAAELRGLAEELCQGHEEEGYGLVIRTNGAEALLSDLRDDILSVLEQYRHLMTTGICGRSGELVYRNVSGYLSLLKSAPLQGIDQILTDREELYREIDSYLPDLVKSGRLTFYQDNTVSLSTLYHLRGTMEELLGNRVWLNSGANIIIESLETLTVIDVNSGKNLSRKPETLFHINLEAAKEIARQLRLRNISGMVIIDFINLKDEKQKQELIHVIREELKKDPVPARFIDITKLGLVEITRKKGYKSLREIFSSVH